MQEETVVVLMSTYNGERFLEKQLLSILQQQSCKVYLVIRDDGSSDKTVSIIKHYATIYANIKLIEGENVGFVQSFNELLQFASKLENKYFAFVDQDDIWLKRKLQTAIDYLRISDENMPCAFSSNSTLIDKKDNPIGTYIPFPLKLTKATLLINGLFQGCSMVFNKKAVEIYAAHPSPLKFHDLWMVYVCTFFGQFHFSDECLFLYRLHEKNVAGRKVKPKPKGLKAVIASFYFWTQQHCNHQDDALVFYHEFERQLNSSDKDLIFDYIHYKERLLSKLHLFFDKDVCPIRNGTFKEKFVYKLHILFNKI